MSNHRMGRHPKTFAFASILPCLFCCPPSKVLDKPSRCSARDCWRRCQSAARSSSFAPWLCGLKRPRSLTPRSRPSRTVTAHSQGSGAKSCGHRSEYPAVRVAAASAGGRGVDGPGKCQPGAAAGRVAAGAAHKRRGKCRASQGPAPPGTGEFERTRIFRRSTAM